VIGFWMAQVAMAGSFAVSLDCPAGTVQKGEGPPHGTFARCVDPEGHLVGPWQVWHPNGPLEKRTVFDLSGEVHGAWETWYPSGQEAVHHTYDHGIRHGPSTFWHDNGQMGAQGRFERGVPVGGHRAWDVAGQLVAEEALHDGTGEIPYWTISSGAVQKGVDTWQGGQLIRQRRYYASGQLASDTPYVGGQHHGIHREWHENGQLAKQGAYRDGRPIGDHDAWNADGTEVEAMCAHGPCDAPPRQKVDR